MENGIFKYILRYSKGQQLYLLLVTAVSFPFLYISLDIPKTIINEAIGGSDFPTSIIGIEFDQTPYLMTLCAIFLTLVFINGGFKYYINVYRGVIAERMLRRLRFQLIHRVLRFPLPHFRSISSGEIVSMVATETEPLGGFFGDAFSLVTFQGGTLLTILVFMFIQDWVLGTAALALYPIQAYVIPKLQRQVNLLAKERVKNVRKLSERLGEMVTGVTDIHAHDTAQFEMADFASRLGAIYQIRFQIYRKKFFIKFINNFLAQLTPFFFFSIGGYLVIEGSLSLGALVAILAAYKDLSAPWKELLAYYQRMEDARIKYDQLAERFQPAGMIEENLLEPHEGPVEDLAGTLVASNVSLEEEEGTKTVESASFTFETSEHVALVGSAGGGADGIARLLARLVSPTSGQITVEGKRLSNLPEAVTGRRIAYVDQESYIRSGTIKDTLLYGLKHYPGESSGEGDGNGAWKNEQEEALKSGNSPFDIRADWIDYEIIGAEGPGDMNDRMIQTLVAVGLEDDVFQLGLRRVVDPQAYPELAEGVLQARSVVREKLSEPALGELVETFDVETFNTNASVAENILFGTPVGKTFDIEDLGKDPYVVDVLEKSHLTQDFLEIGRAIAAIMVELFHDLPPGHEFFEQFSFIDADDLPEFQRILNHVEKQGIDNIAQEDRDLLNQLPFKLIPARHRLGLIEDDMRKRILETRRTFSQNLPEDLRDAVEFFDAGSYNAASSIQDNILFGKVAGGKAESATRIGELVAEVIEGVGLRMTVIEAGLDFEVGIAGKRLSPAQRQKLAIARVLLKRPQLTIVNEATAALDTSTQAAVFGSLKNMSQDSGLVWVENEIGDAQQFDRILVEDHGRVTEQVKDAAAKPPPEAAPAPAEDGAALGQEVGLLAKIPLFAGMERSKLKLLAFTSERQDFEEGQVLFNQGDPGDRAFVIVDGAVDVIVETADGPQVLSKPGRGDVIGELALLCEEPRTATVKANQPLTVLSISGDVFFRLIQENPDVSVALTRIVAKRLVQTMKQMG